MEITKYTFWKLINEYSIEIPIIQRDYAQGRTSERVKEIRSNFLNSLYDVINNGSTASNKKIIRSAKLPVWRRPLFSCQAAKLPFRRHDRCFFRSIRWRLPFSYQIGKLPILRHKIYKVRSGFRFSYQIKNLTLRLHDEDFLKSYALDFDFIYGSSIEEETRKKKLIPLDGQQRLTTLFLLHWYLATKDNKIEDFRNVFLIDNKSKFTYETRTSSKDFCNRLIANDVNLPDDGKSLSGEIKDASWFFLSWEKDPTIKSMLVMLDAIHDKFKGSTGFFEKMTSPNNPPVTFQFIPIKDFGLTDSLYIKMNARGKALTDFENFKACFERYVFDKKWEIGIELTKTFSNKIDTVWTDLFWKHRNSKNQIDDAFIKFIAGIAINLYAQNQDIYESKEQYDLIKKELEEKTNKSVTDKAIKRERIERRIRVLSDNPNEVNPNDFLNEEYFKYLVNCLDIYADNNNDELIPEELELWEYCNKDSTTTNPTLFKEFIKDKGTTYKQRVLFYAQTEFLITNTGFNMAAFSDWMRVVRNIVQNSSIDASTLTGALGLIKELSKGSGNIYDHLSKNSIQSKFARDQVDEEILKSKLIVAACTNKQVIHETEDTNFCKGKINFALYCIDYLKIDHKKTGNSFDVNKLSDIKKVIIEHLNGDDISNELRRALLTIGNNDFYNYRMGWSSPTNSHRRCLITNTLDLKNNFTHGYYQDYLKQLLVKLISKSLDDIIKQYIWKVEDNINSLPESEINLLFEIFDLEYPMSYLFPNICPVQMPIWKKLLIKNPKWLDKYCQSKYIGIITDNAGNEVSCLLYKSKIRPSSRKECKEVK